MQIKFSRRALVKFLLTKKYWRSAGERRTKSSISTKLSRCFFNGTKLTKKVELKSRGDEKCKNLQLVVKPRILPIPCYTTLLSELSYCFNVFPFFNFHSVNPFAFLPMTVAAAKEALVKI